MKSFTIGCIVTAILSLSLPAGNNSYINRSTVESLENRQNAFFTAVSARNADKAAEFFSETAVLHVANRDPVEGRDAIYLFYRNMFGFLTASEAIAQSIRVSGSGDMAYSFGQTVNSFGGPDGVVEFKGKYVLIWEKIDAEWMITLYGISSNEPAESR